MKIAKALGLAVLNSLQLLGHTRGRDGGVREELAAGVAVTPSKCSTLARCLTCETLGHARAHGCRDSLVSRLRAGMFLSCRSALATRPPLGARRSALR